MVVRKPTYKKWWLDFQGTPQSPCLVLQNCLFDAWLFNSDLQNDQFGFWIQQAHRSSVFDPGCSRRPMHSTFKWYAKDIYSKDMIHCYIYTYIRIRYVDTIYYTYVSYIAYHVQISSKPVHQPVYLYSFGAPAESRLLGQAVTSHVGDFLLRTYCIVCCCTVSPKPAFLLKTFSQTCGKKTHGCLHPILKFSRVTVYPPCRAFVSGIGFWNTHHLLMML